MAKHRRLLTEACNDLHISRAAIAKRLGVSVATLRNWERAERAPMEYYFPALKRVFGVIDIDDFLEITDDADDSPAESSTSTPIVVSASPSLITTSPTLRFLTIAHTEYNSLDEMTSDIQSAIKDLNTVGDMITRRDALCELAAIPLIGLGKHGTLHAKRYEEMLRFCTAALDGCWELYRGSDPVGARYAFECTSTYVPLLETIAHDSSGFRNQALDLATKYALMKTLLGWNCIGARETIGHAQHALFLSKESGNILLQISARTKLSFTYLMGENCAMALKTMQEGEHMLKSYQRGGKGEALPIGIVGNFYSSYSLAEADNGIDANRAIGVATDCEPLSEHTALIEFSLFDQWWEASRACSSKGDSAQTMKWLTKIIDPETLVTHVPMKAGAQITVLSGLVSALLQSPERDMERIVKIWTMSMEGAKALLAEQKYRKAMTNFAVMRSLWPGEPAIRQLMPLTSHW